MMDAEVFETNGLNLCYRYWPAEGRQERPILCIHGLAGDSRIFNYFAKKSAALGHHVYALDLPGYGMSDGDRGDVSFDLTIKCLHDVVSQICKKHENRKIFLLGFSLGALHALWYASMYKDLLNGVIALSPHLRIKRVKRDPRSEPSKKILLVALLRYLVTPSEKTNLSKAVPTAFGKLAGDEWNYMMKDPLCNFNYSYRYIFNTLIGRAEKIEPLYKLQVPLLVMHGKNDFNVVVEQSKTLVNRLDHTDKELRIFECDHWFYHTFFYTQYRYSENERSSIIKTITEWIERKSAG
ncbi:MAG: alpha/beta fold hydrolase [Nitrososphaerales archaeon]